MYMAWYSTATVLIREQMIDWATYEELAPFEIGFLVAILKREMEERSKK